MTNEETVARLTRHFKEQDDTLSVGKKDISHYLNLSQVIPRYL